MCAHPWLTGHATILWEWLTVEWVTADATISGSCDPACIENAHQLVSICQVDNGHAMFGGLLQC